MPTAHSGLAAQQANENHNDNGDDEVGGNAQNEAVGEPLQRFVASNCGGVGVLTGGDDLGHTTAGEHHNQGGDERL